MASESGSKTSCFGRLLSYCKRHRGVALLAIVGSLGSMAATSIAPLIVREIVDNVILARRGSLTPWIVLLIGLGLVRYAFGAIRRYYAGKLGFDVDFDIRTDVFDALQRLDGRQQDRLRTGQVVSRAISDVRQVPMLLQNIPTLTSGVLTLLVSVVIMLTLSPALTIVALAILPVLSVFLRRATNRVFPAFWDWSQQAGEVAGVVESSVTGVRVVKGFGQEQHEQQKLEAAAGKLFLSGLRRTLLVARFFPAASLIPSLGQVGVLAFGGWLAIRGDLTLGTFLAFSTYLGMMIAPIWMINGLLAFVPHVKAGLERISEILDTKPTIDDAPGAVDAPEGPLVVELDDVTFGYEVDFPDLHNVSLRIEPGETLALAGGAGSGKSTVALLLARFYDPQAGTVRLGGQDLRTLTLRSLRSRLGMVFEDGFLFFDTIFANIAFGRSGATHGDVEAVARAAQADEFIRDLPEAYDTVVGERGLTLSGGQRQRIALARALLADPSVLVLDDATSAVDAGVEAEIHAALRQAMTGRTTLLIAHRRSTLQLADRIAVMHHGELVDIGTHEELTTRCPRYRQLLAGHDDEIEGDSRRSSVGEKSTPNYFDGQNSETREATEGTIPELWVEAESEADEGLFGRAGLPPEQAVLVATLPPTTEKPRVDLNDARAIDLSFGLRRLWRPFRTPLLTGLVVSMLVAGAGLAIPWLTRAGVDHGIEQHSMTALFSLSGIALLVVILNWVLNVWQAQVIGRTGETMLYWLRVKAFAHLQRLGLDFYEHERGGQVMTRMTTDIDSLTSFVQTGVNQAMISALSVMGAIGLLLLLDPALTLGVLLVLPAFVTAVLIFRKFGGPAYEEVRERLSTVNADFQENVSGIRAAQAYGREPYNRKRYRGLVGDYRRAQLRAQLCHSIFVSFFEFVEAPATAIVLGLGASRVIDGSLSTGTLIAFLLYLTMLLSPLQQVSQVVDGYQRAKVGLDRLRELLRTPTSTPETAEPVSVGRLSGAIEFSDVWFAYSGASDEALRGVSLRISPGETVAVVGETGAGKTTLMKLIARFYDTTSGTVLIDGIDIRSLDLTAYRHRLGLVPQETHLFAGTVRDSIAYGRPTASDAEVIAAARAVGAHEMITSLRGGYLHQVGEHGGELSAGQRQLLALARAQLVDPDILLLDEATAALDLATEAAVARATDRISSKRTTLVIAHRLTTAQQADRIVVVDGGQIVEVGIHSELLAAGGRYAQLWAAFTGHAPEPS